MTPHGWVQARLPLGPPPTSASHLPPVLPSGLEMHPLPVSLSALTLSVARSVIGTQKEPLPLSASLGNSH